MSETMGRCRIEVYERRGSPSELKIAAAIDRLAADVAAVKEAVCDGSVAEERDRFLAGMGSAIKERDAAIRERDEARKDVERMQEELDDREQTEQVKRLREANETLHRKSINYIHDRDQYIRERDEARAEVERLKNELYDREQEILSLRADTVERYTPPAAPQPAAPPAGWLTDEERHILSAHLQALREQRRAMERGGQTLGYSANPCGLKREADAIDALLARAGSPPGQTAALWLTDKERAVVEDIASMIQQWFKMAWSDTDEKRCAVLRSILARAGSPPVVEVPELGFLGPMTGREHGIVLGYLDAMNAAGVAWKRKEVPRE